MSKKKRLIAEKSGSFESNTLTTYFQSSRINIRGKIGQHISRKISSSNQVQEQTFCGYISNIEILQSEMDIPPALYELIFDTQKVINGRTIITM